MKKEKLTIKNISGIRGPVNKNNGKKANPYPNNNLGKLFTEFISN